MCVCRGLLGCTRMRSCDKNAGGGEAEEWGGGGAEEEWWAREGDREGG